MLGLLGYYGKFIPSYSLLVQPQAHLTRKIVPFFLSENHQKLFEMLKQTLLSSPILVYPDPKTLFTMFTDASKYVL